MSYHRRGAGMGVKILRPPEPRSRTLRAGLVFPVGRIHRFLRKGSYADRLGSGAPVYLAAVLEYLTAELLDVARKAARAHKKRRITPRHVKLAVQGDDDLCQLLMGVTIPQGGVLPHIAKELLPKATTEPSPAPNGRKDGARAPPAD
ncbi:late histone H2A.2.2-like [Haemaphysalis longicornis]